MVLLFVLRFKCFSTRRIVVVDVLTSSFYKFLFLMMRKDLCGKILSYVLRKMLYMDLISVLVW